MSAQLFLEDAYEMTGYVLEAGSPAALRGDARQRQKQQLQKGSASKQSLLKVISRQPMTGVPTDPLLG